MVDKPTDFVIVTRFTVFTCDDGGTDDVFRVCGDIGRICGIRGQMTGIRMVSATEIKPRCLKGNKDRLIILSSTDDFLDVLLPRTIKSELNLRRMHSMNIDKLEIFLSAEEGRFREAGWNHCPLFVLVQIVRTRAPGACKYLISVNI